MNVNEITFGIEIECYVRGIEAGAYHVGRPIPGFPAGWTAQYDGSLGAGGVEIVSPVLKGADGVRQVIEVVKKLNEMRARVNQRCGFHVHVGFNKTPVELERLVHLVANFEKAIFASTGTKKREQGNYCRTIKPWKTQLNYSGTLHQLGNRACDRYHVLNVSNLVSGAKPTVEFRAFAGTLNITKILGYVRMCVGFVQRALDVSRKTNWDAKTPSASSPIHRSGVGQTELTRLFYQLGWTKGRTKTVYGDLQAEGAPTMKAVKKQMMKLAAKYDATQQ